MKSFPSTINESRSMYGNGKSNAYARTFDIDRLTHGALNLNKSVPVVSEQLKEVNINVSNFQAYPGMTTVTHPTEYASTSEDAMFNKGEDEWNLQMAQADGEEGKERAERYQNLINERNKTGQYNSKKQQEKIYYENPLQLPAEIIALAKDYDWAYRYMVKEFVDVGEKHGDSLKVNIANTAIAPSMFNPMYGVSVLGIIRNTPLLNDVDDPGINPKVSDCSIRTLCALSKQVNSELGMARYKYADFMFCKDLGKVSNNHLITLRRFSSAAPDHITELATPRYISGEYSFEVGGDVGRLVTWFGTEDNKLEDIIKFSYHATFKHLQADIQQENGTADDPSSGIVGMIANTFNPVYNRGVRAGTAGTHNLWGWLGSKLSAGKNFQGIGKNNELLRNYDNNKVYTPKDTIQESHIYEGKLEFTHTFTLTFSYVLRAYENINPRSAFLDLIGNILEVTYRRGKFWGGERKVIGPATNMAPFRTVESIVDGSWSKLGSLFTALDQGEFNIKNILGAIGRSAGGAVEKMFNMIQAKVNDLVKNPTGTVKEAGKSALDAAGKVAAGTAQLFSATGAADNWKGQILNVLGRPQAIAWHSLLTGEPYGFWHVTIGNPRNPIMSIGNLILENATIIQSGPLGLDDFPSELKVICEMKHCTPRDITTIGRMYTKGSAAIYHKMAAHKLEDFWGSDALEIKNDQDNKDVNVKDMQVQANSKGEADAKGSSNNDAPKYRNPNAEGMAATSIEQSVADNRYKTGYYNSVPILGGDESGLPNPFIETAEHEHIYRTNNYAPKMLRMALDEMA